MLDFWKISRILESKYSIFYKFWNIGRPVFTDKIPTAAVAFDKEGQCVLFMFNEEFYHNIDNYTRSFIVAHEMLHVLLEHGKRGKNKIPEVANIAMDLVINHTLVNKFGFDRDQIINGEDLCWVDKFFKVPVGTNLSFEQYYELLLDESKSNIKVHYVLVDSHDFSSFEDSGELVEMTKEELDKADQALKHDNGIKAGAEQGSKFIKLKPKKSYKHKWETIIKNWARPFMDYKIEEQWQKDRKYACISDEFMLPSDKFIDNDEKKKIQVYFFQDTSGSCVHLAERFFKASNSLHPDRFDVKMYCFDTKVYPVVDGKLSGFGGTSFQCIDQFVNRLPRHPDAVFIITDGYGDSVKPVKGKKWYWFLSENYTECIPKECNIYKLEDFE